MDIENCIFERFKVMEELALKSTHNSRVFMNLDCATKKKLAGYKHDQTMVTLLDYQTQIENLVTWKNKFPNDSYYGEELEMLIKCSRFKIYEDPLDNTCGAIHYMSGESAEKSPVTHLMSLTHNDVPVAFTLGIPIKNTIFSGNVFQGIFIDKKVYSQKRNPTLIVGLNEHVHETMLCDLIGANNIHIAGACAWLIIQGYTAGGINKFELPHEGNCISAIVRCMQGTITNIHGESYQTHDPFCPAVWSFPPLSHTEMLNKARSII